MQETEADTRANRIDPILKEAGWNVLEGSQISRELTIAPGRILAGGERANSLSADSVLPHKGRQLAVVEAKRADLGHLKISREHPDIGARKIFRVAPWNLRRKGGGAGNE